MHRRHQIMLDTAMTFYLPDTLARWPWPRTISPHFGKVDAASAAWFLQFKALQPKSQKAFDRGRFGLLAALAFPRASEEHFLAACNLMRLLFFIDEYTDVSDAAAAREVADIAVDALKNPHKARPEGEIVIGELVRKFWAETIESASAASQRHFIKQFADYIYMVITEAADRDAGICRTIEDYLAVRRGTVATRPSFMPLELPLEIPDEVYFHPVVTKLIDYISELIIIDNDIASYNREQSTGDENHNLITAVMHQFNCDVGSAMAWAAGYHDEIEGKFINGLKAVPSWGPVIDKQLHEYLDGIANWVQANYSWGFESERYHGTRGSEIQRTRIVPLLPREKPNPEVHKDGVIVASIDM
ncbi:terpenoid synthase [Leucogyrophana mollusca]|uniref:Terpenoid synthase n=1 Tax=Leucogyrophana mollusca TaxID=85980 RepID=A0ACB8BKX8_9AGAM|nr:terpenoid synthase [Leucogyrophana mollusca]